MAVSFVTVPDGGEVAAFLGQGANTELVALAEEHIVIIAAMARSYTRGQGWTAGPPVTVADDLAAVITTATARLLSNPAQSEMEQVGPYTRRGAFNGWTLAETFVLNRYRKRAR